MSEVYPQPSPSPAPDGGHVVHFYEDDADLAGAVTRFLAEGARAGDALLVIATAAHRAVFERRLREDGIEPGRFELRDAEEMLSTFMRGGEPDAILFEAAVGRLVTALAAPASGRRLRAYGEMVDVLWQRGQHKAALRLEELWNDLQGRAAFDLLCAYSVGSFLKEPARRREVCALHTGANGDGLEAEPAEYPPRYARRLAREIAHREEVEQALRQSLQELRRSEEQLQLIIDGVPALVAFIDAEHRYRVVSGAYERWFGRSRSEIVGRHARDVLGEAAYRTVGPYLDRALAGDEVTYEADVPYRDAGTRSIEARYIPLRGRDGTVSGLATLVVDVSERKRFERFQATAAGRAERLHRITAALADAVSPEQVFEAVVDHVAAAVDASSAGLWLLGEDGQTARLSRSLGYAEKTRAQIEELRVDSRARLPVLDTLRDGEPLFIPSQEDLLRSYPHLRGVADPARDYRVVCLPLLSRGRPLGVLGLTIERPGEESAEERDFLLLVARYASQAMERLRLLEAERLSRQEAEQLYRFAAAVVAADRVEQVFDAALSAIESALGADRSAILLCDAAGVMRFRGHRNLSEGYRRAVEGHSPWKSDEASPQPILIEDALHDPSMSAYAALFREEGIGALAFIPLVNTGRLLGKFMVYFADRHRFTPHEVQTGVAIASHLASVTVRFDVIARLEETVRSNELFAGVLAHDLRNPLGAITTAAQLLLMRSDGEAAGARSFKALGRILTSGERMNRMIDQLLDFTRARSGGGIEIRREPTDLADLVEHAIEELSIIHPEWLIEREVVGELTGRWDGDRLVQVISNVVANAGQHGRTDAPVRVKLDGTGSDQVRLEVRNAGAVPEALLPHLFDPFRSTGHRRSGSRGLGLGLFIVREVVRAHGGRVDVTSTEIEGTTFTIELPRG